MSNREPSRHWPQWQRILAYAIYAAAAAVAIELVDVKVHQPAMTTPAATQR